ncbi:hypothetical protein [Nocardia nova]|uniref:hypothetical protein n=1 Tax=Nocardia nova TaxID=37330 RepID=UPI0033DEF934
MSEYLASDYFHVPESEEVARGFRHTGGTESLEDLYQRVVSDRVYARNFIPDEIWVEERTDGPGKRIYAPTYSTAE